MNFTLTILYHTCSGLYPLIAISQNNKDLVSYENTNLCKQWLALDCTSTMEKDYIQMLKFWIIRLENQLHTHEKNLYIVHAALTSVKNEVNKQDTILSKTNTHIPEFYTNEETQYILKHHEIKEVMQSIKKEVKFIQKEFEFIITQNYQDINIAGIICSPFDDSPILA